MNMRGIGDKVGGVLLLVSACAIVGGASYLAITNQPPPRDNDSLCAAQLEHGHTIVLVDKTDPWNEHQANRIESHLLWLVTERMKVEERLSIFAFGDTVVPGFAPTFSFCKPPSGREANDVTTSKRIYETQYRKQFWEPLKRALDDIKRAGNLECSPIVEVMIEILTRREISGHAGPNRVVLISDMAQNGPEYSLFSTSKCVRGGTGKSQRSTSAQRDYNAVRQLIEQRKNQINLKDMSMLVFQVEPMNRSEEARRFIAEQARRDWNEWMGWLSMTIEWQRL